MEDGPAWIGDEQDACSAEWRLLTVERGIEDEKASANRMEVQPVTGNLHESLFNFGVKAGSASMFAR